MNSVLTGLDKKDVVFINNFVVPIPTTQPEAVVAIIFYVKIHLSTIFTHDVHPLEALISPWNILKNPLSLTVMFHPLRTRACTYKQ